MSIVNSEFSIEIKFYKMKHIKCNVVGNSNRDNARLLVTHTTDVFPDEYVPPVFDDYSANINFEDQVIHLVLCQTPFYEDYKKLRPLSYPQTDVFIICFSLVSPKSLQDVEDDWVPDLKKHCPGVPYILVGLRSGLRDEFHQHEEEYKAKGWEPIQREKGEEMKEKIGAQCYIECDAKKNINVKEVFESAVRAALHKPSDEGKKKKKKGKQKKEKKEKKGKEKEECILC